MGVQSSFCPNLQSSIPSFPTCLMLVYKRRVTNIMLVSMREVPTPRTADSREGASMKLGGSPFGLRARNTLDKFVAGGNFSIVT